MLRKKRVTISEQAQAAIAAGMPVDQALAEHGTPVPAAEASSQTDPDTPAPAAIDPPTEGDPAAAVVDPVEGDDAVQDPNLAQASDDDTVTLEATSYAVDNTHEDDTALTSVLDRLQTAQNTIATQAAQITQMEATAEQITATQESLMAVAVAATHRMQIPLGGVATDLSSLSVENLLAQYQSTLAAFEKRFPVGGKAEVPVEDEDRDGKVVPLVSPAVARATQIRK